jgi:hypothetical protein
LALLDHELFLVSDLFETLRVPVILLKGMDLGRRYYPHRAERPMTDIDLLILPKDADRVTTQLLGRGYLAIGKSYKGRHCMEFARNHDLPCIELHWRLKFSDHDLDTEKLFQRAQFSVFNDLPKTFGALSVSDNFIYLLEHSALQHRLEDPKWIADFYYLTKNLLPRDWIAILDCVETNSLWLPYFVTLRLVENNFDTHLINANLSLAKSKIPFFRRLIVDEFVRSLSGKYGNPLTPMGSTEETVEKVLTRLFLQNGVKFHLRYLYQIALERISSK